MTNERRSYLVPGVLLFSLVLVRAPILFGGQPPLAVYVVTLLPFCVAIASLSLWPARWTVDWAVLLAVGYLALVVIAGFRAGYFDVISESAALRQMAQFSLVALLGMFAFLREPRAEQRALHLRALCWAPAVFLAVNVGLYFLGILPVGEYTADAEQPATMLGLLGLESNRVLFPLANGVTGIGPIAAMALGLSATLALRGEQRKLALVAALLALYVILAIDSRGALLFGLLAFTLVAVAPRGRKHRLGWVAIALPALPVVLVLVLTGVAESDVGTELDRGGIANLNTATGRTVVWEEVIDVFDRPSADHLFGYGQSGQIVSGASVGYAYLVTDSPEPLAHTAHSVILQTLLDLGWVGLLCFLALAAMVLTRLGRRAGDPRYAALLAATLSLLLLGIVQATPTTAHPDSFASWLLVVFAAVRAERVTSGAAP